jgi:hypothetical protein
MHKKANEKVAFTLKKKKPKKKKTKKKKPTT